MDTAALKTLNRDQNLPSYFSAELSGRTIEQLVHQPSELVTAVSEFERLGYKKFKLVDQYTLTTLNEKPFYRNQRNIFRRLLKKFENLFNIPSANRNPRGWYCKKMNYHFTVDASGPFGEDILGDWNSADVIKNIIRQRFQEYYKTEKENKHNIFWVDLHATW